MHKIAITGGMGAGKSTAIEVMKKHPFFMDAVYVSIDEMMNDLYEEPAFTNWLMAMFNTCDKAEVSAIIFKDPMSRKQVEFISGAIIVGQLASYFPQLADLGTKICVVEVPLLYELGLNSIFDVTVSVSADNETRIKRIVKRGGKTEAQARTMVHAQMSQVVKDFMATVVFNNNDDTPFDLTAQVDKLSDFVYNNLSWGK